MQLVRTLLTGGLLATTTLGVIAGDIQPGLWHITLNTTVAGSGQSLGPFERTQCFTAADARNPEKLFAEAGAECSYGNRKDQNNRFSFAIRCGGALPMSGSGSVEYGDAAFSGQMSLKAQLPNVGEVETINRVTGNRLGGC